MYSFIHQFMVAHIIHLLCTNLFPMQLSVYVKYSKADNVIRELSPDTKVTCYEEDLTEKYFYSRYTRLFTSCTLLLPIFFITIISVVVRSIHTKINTALAKPWKYGSIVGIFGECVIIGMDIAAVIYVIYKIMYIIMMILIS